MATKKNESSENIITTEAVSKYSREELKKASVFISKADVITAVVSADEELTVAQTQERIEKFMKGKVK